MGSDTDLLANVLSTNKGNSAFIGTSKFANVAYSYAEESIFVIRPRGGIDVNATLGERNPFSADFEVAVPFRIAPEDIRAVTWPDLGISLLNPKWQP